MFSYGAATVTTESAPPVVLSPKAHMLPAQPPAASPTSLVVPATPASTIRTGLSTATPSVPVPGAFQAHAATSVKSLKPKPSALNVVASLQAAASQQHSRGTAAVGGHGVVSVMGGPTSWTYPIPLGSLFGHVFESVYLEMHWSDSNDKKRTVVLQTVLVMNMFASLVPCTRLTTHSRLERPTNETTGSPVGKGANASRATETSLLSPPKASAIAAVGVNTVAATTYLNHPAPFPVSKFHKNSGEDLLHESVAAAAAAAHLPLFSPAAAAANLSATAHAAAKEVAATVLHNAVSKEAAAHTKFAVVASALDQTGSEAASHLRGTLPHHLHMAPETNVQLHWGSTLAEQSINTLIFAENNDATATLHPELAVLADAELHAHAGSKWPPIPPSNYAPVAITTVLFFFTFSKSSYFVVIQVSDCNDKTSTMVLQTVLVMIMFSSPLASRLDHDFMPRTSVFERKPQGPTILMPTALRPSHSSGYASCVVASYFHGVLGCVLRDCISCFVVFFHFQSLFEGHGSFHGVSYLFALFCLLSSRVILASRW
jgi:hypothetical protein